MTEENRRNIKWLVTECNIGDVIQLSSTDFIQLLKHSILNYFYIVTNGALLLEYRFVRNISKDHILHLSRPWHVEASRYLGGKDVPKFLSNFLYEGTYQPDKLQIILNRHENYLRRVNET